MHMSKGDIALKLYGPTLICIISQLQMPTGWLMWGYCTHILIIDKISVSFPSPSSYLSLFYYESDNLWQIWVSLTIRCRSPGKMKVREHLPGVSAHSGTTTSIYSILGGNGVGKNTHDENFLFTSQWVSPNGCGNVFKEMNQCCSSRKGDVLFLQKKKKIPLSSLLFCWRGRRYKNRIGLWIPSLTMD